MQALVPFHLVAPCSGQGQVLAHLVDATRQPSAHIVVVAPVALGIGKTFIQPQKSLSATVAHLIEQFGPERCMFESNFPVDKASYAYTTVWNAFKLVSQDFSAAERVAMFQGTAVKAYRL